MKPEVDEEHDEDESPEDDPEKRFLIHEGIVHDARRIGQNAAVRLPVDSPANPRVAAALRALRDGERIPLEGARSLAEALAAGVVPESVFFEEGSADEALLARAEGAGARLHPASGRVVGRLSDLATSRGVVALAPLPPHGLEALPREDAGTWLLLDGLQDPSNVGAILRSAEAFGAAGALLSVGCASPFSARALRASAGSALRLPLATGIPLPRALAWLAERGIPLAGGVARGGCDPATTPLPRPVAIAVGSEGSGLSPETERALRVRLTLPMLGRVESLNAAVAASLLLYLRGQA